MASGYGAFLEKFKEYKCIATECDDLSVQLLKQNFPEVPIYEENSLLNVSRNKYNLSNEKLIIVGNPPYNDITSQYKKGQKGNNECDEDLLSRDLGISFLKCYDKLETDYICVLHPLSYLIKETNFKQLGDFSKHYKLISGKVFSSKEFESIKKTNAEFPVISALYKRGESMDYNYIKTFSFDILGNKRKFKLSNIKTIDGIVKKYPSKEKQQFQFYTLRDINSLLRNTTFVNGPINNGINLEIVTVYQYCWLQFFKDNFKRDDMFIYGNLSPLWSDEIDNPDIKNQLVSYVWTTNSIFSKLVNKQELEKEYGELQMNSDYASLWEILNNLHY